jgi:hypothetical protein
MQESKTIVAGSGAQVHELVRQEGMFRVLGLMTAIPETRTSQLTTRKIGQDFDECARRWSKTTLCERQLGWSGARGA